MKFEVSYTTYGIPINSEKQGFNIYSVSGFIDDFEMSDKFKLFQTPSEIVLLENESVYSLFLSKMGEFNFIFLNHQWYTGRSKGNRNCYDGFSMALKYKNILPDIISLSHTFFNQLTLNKQTNELLVNSSLQKFISFNISNKSIGNITSRNKKKLIELHCNNINIEEVIFNVFNSIFRRNKYKRYIYFTQSKTLFDRVLFSSIDKVNFCEDEDDIQITIPYKWEQTNYNLDSTIEKELKLNIEKLNKIKAEIELEQNFLNELKSNINLNRVKYENEVQRKKEEIYYLENRLSKLRKMIFYYIRFNKKTPLFIGLLLMIISGLITLAITNKSQ